MRGDHPLRETFTRLLVYSAVAIWEYEPWMREGHPPPTPVLGVVAATTSEAAAATVAPTPVPAQD